MSLGAGVQSSALCWLFEDGLLENPPDIAIFADTQNEPREVYAYLQTLKREIKLFPILQTTRGNLAENPAKVPLFVKRPDGKRGMGYRQCTSEYKIKQVERAVREFLGYAKGKWMRHEVEMILGISADEEGRRRVSRNRRETLRYPLLDELYWTRKECLLYFESCGRPLPPRSACTFCPYRSNKEWAEMKQNNPLDFEAACRFDESVRDKGGLNFAREGRDAPGEQFVHYSLTPLRNADLSAKHSKRYGMENECEGMCGI